MIQGKALMLLLLVPSLLLAAEPKKEIKKTNVETQHIKLRPLRSYASYIGHLIPAKRITITAEVSGKIAEANFTNGKSFKKGETILKFDQQRILINYRVQNSNYKTANDAYQRELKLFKRQLSSKAKLQGVLNKKEMAEYQKELARLDLQETSIKAPWDAVISKKQAAAGEYRSKGQPLVELIQISSLKALVHLPERDIRHAQIGKKVTATFESLPNRSFEGTITTVGQEADQNNRSFTIEITILNPKHELLSGMLAEVTLLTMNLTEQILIPRHAVMEDEQGSFVFVVRGNLAIYAPVQLGVSLGAEVQITAGISEGEELIVVGQQLITHQEPVNITNQPVQAEVNPPPAAKKGE